MAIYQITKVHLTSTWYDLHRADSIEGLVFATDKHSVIAKDLKTAYFVGKVIPLNCANYMPISERISVNSVEIRRLFK